MKTSSKVFNNQFWTVESCQVVDHVGKHLARMNRELDTNGNRDPTDTDALTYLLAAAPAMFRVIENLRNIYHGPASGQLIEAIGSANMRELCEAYKKATAHDLI